MKQELRIARKKMDSLDCKGECYESCGPILFNNRDRKRISDYCRQNGIEYHDIQTPSLLQTLQWELMQDDDIPVCPYLKDNKCSVYPVRPMICHLWGATEKMECHKGCVPIEGYITEDEAKQIILATGGRGD